MTCRPMSRPMLNIIFYADEWELDENKVIQDPLPHTSLY